MEDVLNPDHVDQLYNAIFPSNAKYKYRSAGDTFILWLCDDKLLRSCNQNKKEESPATVSHASSFQDIGESEEVVKPSFCFASPDDESDCQEAKGKDADFLQCQRSLPDEEDLSNVVIGDAYDLESQEQDTMSAHDEDNDGWTTVTNKRKQKRKNKFESLQTENEASRGEVTI